MAQSVLYCGSFLNFHQGIKFNSFTWIMPKMVGRRRLSQLLSSSGVAAQVHRCIGPQTNCYVLSFSGSPIGKGIRNKRTKRKNSSELVSKNSGKISSFPSNGSKFLGIFNLTSVARDLRPRVPQTVIPRFQLSLVSSDSVLTFDLTMPRSVWISGNRSNRLPKVY